MDREDFTIFSDEYVDGFARNPGKKRLVIVRLIWTKEIIAYLLRPSFDHGILVDGIVAGNSQIGGR